MGSYGHLGGSPGCFALSYPAWGAAIMPTMAHFDLLARERATSKDQIINTTRKAGNKPDAGNVAAEPGIRGSLTIQTRPTCLMPTTTR